MRTFGSLVPATCGCQVGCFPARRRKLIDFTGAAAFEDAVAPDTLPPGVMERLVAGGFNFRLIGFGAINR